MQACARPHCRSDGAKRVSHGRMTCVRVTGACAFKFVALSTQTLRSEVALHRSSPPVACRLLKRRYEPDAYDGRSEFARSFVS
jgi:hypothetical protein